MICILNSSNLREYAHFSLIIKVDYDWRYYVIGKDKKGVECGSLKNNLNYEVFIVTNKKEN